MSFNIVIDDAVVEAEQLFSPYGTPIIVPGRDIPKYAQQADALIIRSRTQITEQLLVENPRIRFIGSTVVGLDHVDEAACQRHGVTFYSAQGCNARSVAEYVISNLVTYAIQQQRNFETLTLAIIGVGHVGKQVEKLANTLGIRCLLNDPFRAENERDFQHTELTRCLAQADIITLHTPLTQTGKHPTYHLIDHHNLPLVKQQACIINAARGDIINETTLLSRQDLTLIIDCWHNEPLISEALLTASTLATPHIAGHAWDAKYRGGLMARDALVQWLAKNTAHQLTTNNKEAITLPIARPEQAAQKIHLAHDHQETDAQKQLSQILQHAYAFEQDDAVLRHALSTERAQQFEDYRRNYPLRREWTQQPLQIQGLSVNTIEWAQALGFLI